ncbi:MAG: hypothetical protein ABSG57_02605 [Candidatus Bathyarchaeia archaeon]
MQIGYVGGGPSEVVGPQAYGYDWPAAAQLDGVSFGLSKTVNCRAVTAYCDCLKMIIGGSNY